MLPLVPVDPPENETNKRKPYSKPEITHELELETRAGSTVGLFPDALDEDLTQ
jgi:hypothetical protein